MHYNSMNSGQLRNKMSDASASEIIDKQRKIDKTSTVTSNQEKALKMTAQQDE